jgi:hypothetical protein
VKFLTALLDKVSVLLQADSLSLGGNKDIENTETSTTDVASLQNVSQNQSHYTQSDSCKRIQTG